MQIARLGKADLYVSRIGLGTMQFGGEWGHDFTQSEVNRIVDAARDGGINLIDTAECYGDHRAERLLGGALAQDRTRWIIATKFGHRFTGFCSRDECWTPEAVRKQLDESLTALRTDYVDLYQFHSGSLESLQDDAIWEVLLREQQAGRIRCIGVSLRGSDMAQVREAHHRHSTFIQVRLNRLDREATKDVLPFCVNHEIGVLARVPLASGYLTGKYSRQSAFPSDDIRSTHDQQQIGSMLAEVDRIRAAEVPAHVPLSRWAIRWCLQHEGVTSVLVGCKSPTQAKENVQAAVESFSTLTNDRE